MKNNRIYISGAITGITDYLERFSAAEENLKAAGWEVINTTKLESVLPTLEWGEYMDIDFVFMTLCGSVFVLNGSENSAGVAYEREFAEACGMTIYEEADGIPVFESEVIDNA